MISIAEAKHAIESIVKAMPEKKLSLDKSLGCVLFRDVFAQIDSPPFDKSAMDGFAIGYDDLRNQKVFKISQTIKTGDVPQARKMGTAVRIMTGAMLPDGVDAVIPIENVKESNEEVVFEGDISKGQFIRRRGKEIKRGELMLPKGHLINLASLGFLASQGIKEVSVFDSPEATIITTGNEVVDSRRTGKLNSAQIFDSNLISISVCLSNIGVENKSLGIVEDDPSVIKSVISEGLKSKILIVSGGISVGKYDFVRTTLNDLGVKEVFWRVRQKPGKPLYFGVSKTGGYVFAIPGNPAATIVCLYEYVLPAIRKMMGYENIWPMEFKVRLERPIEWERDRVEFVRGIFNPQDQTVMPFAENESHMLKEFALSNCFILAEKNGFYKKSEEVSVHLI